MSVVGRGPHGPCLQKTTETLYRVLRPVKVKETDFTTKGKRDFGLNLIPRRNCCGLLIWEGKLVEP